MELQQLRYVIALAEEKSFTRAARRCFIVQSSLSHQLKSLEDELGLTLFARNSRRVELTAAGAAFLPSARAAVDAAERAAVDAAAAAGRVRGHLTIGVIPTVTAVDIPAALGLFRRTHPEVPVRLQGGASDAFISAIAKGDMDVAVLGLPDTVAVTTVASRVLARERLVAVIDAAHRLAGRRRLRLEELSSEAFVDFPAGTPGRAPTDLAFAEAGLSREVTFEAADTALILDLVRQGLAVTLLSPAVVPAGSGLVTVPVVGGPTRTEHLAWSSFNPSPAARAFLDIVEAAEHQRERVTPPEPPLPGRDAP